MSLGLCRDFDITFTDFHPHLLNKNKKNEREKMLQIERIKIKQRR